MTTTPQDAAQRAQVLDISRSFIVQAPAGAGKTSLLVHRVLRLLTTVKKPEEVLAITFTRKATEEMRERVIKALRTAAQGKEFEPHEQTLGEDAQRALAHSQKQGWALIDNPQRLRIMTIDALASELVRQMPWSSHFGSLPITDGNIDALCEQAAFNTLKLIDSPSDAHQPHAAAAQTLVTQLGGDINRLSLQIADLLKRRETWLPKLFEHPDTLASRQDVEAAWAAEISAHLTALEQRLSRSVKADLARLGQYAAGQLRAHSKPDTPTSCLIEQSHFPAPDARQLDAWLGHAAMLLTNEGRWRKKPDIRVGFPPDVDEKAEIIALIDTWLDDDDLRAAWHALRSLPPATLSDTQWQLWHALRQLLPIAASELYLQFAAQGQCDFSEITFRAIEALGGEMNPTTLALIQDYRTQHILMDEFQDTSPEQYTLIERLIAGWQAGDGRSLFLVGDPMQAIYGFRGADVRIFLRVLDAGIAQIRPEFVPLSANFRSSPDLIKWVNDLFENVFPAQADELVGAIPYAPADAQKTHAGAVHYHPLEKGCTEVDTVCQLVQDALAEQHTPPEDTAPTVAVLASKRRHLAPIAQALTTKGIAVESVDLEALAEQPVSNDLLALTRALLHPYDHIAWLAVLRAPWCGLSLADLEVIAQHASNAAPNANPSADPNADPSAAAPPIEQLISEPLNALSTEGAAQLRRLHRALMPILTQRGRRRMSQLVRNAWFALHGPACHSAQQAPFASQFLAMLARVEQQFGQLSLTEIHRALGKINVSTAPQKVVLLTMHKAKGLEFDTVILTGLARSTSGFASRRSALLNIEPVHEQLLVAPITPLGEDSSPHGKYLTDLEKQRNQHEKGRLFYVAATRAKRQLHLVAELDLDPKSDTAAPRQPMKNSLLHFIWADTESQWQALQSPPAVSSQAPDSADDEAVSSIAARPAMRQQLPLDYAPPALPESFVRDAPPANPPARIFDWARDIARWVGIITHHYLETATWADIQRWQHDFDRNALAVQLAQAGVPPEQLERACARVHRILTQLADDPTAEWIFKPQHRHIRSEWALSGVVDGQIQHIVIDRSFIDTDTGVRWIIDFKTSEHEGGNMDAFLEEERQRYFDQLTRYAYIVAALEPEQTIQCGLYFPSLQEWKTL